MTSDRRDSLGERIAKAKAAQDGSKDDIRGDDASKSEAVGAQALTYGAEFAGPVVTALLIGLGIDSLAGTRPFGLLILLGLGIAAGFLGVFRTYNRMVEELKQNSGGDGDVSDEE